MKKGAVSQLSNENDQTGLEQRDRENIICCTLDQPVSSISHMLLLSIFWQLHTHNFPPHLRYPQQWEVFLPPHLFPFHTFAAKVTGTTGHADPKTSRKKSS